MAKTVVGRDWIWQDKELKFDCNPALLELIGGETVIERAKDVEDGKGNKGMRGTLLITNLRLIWIANKTNKVNLSVGLNAVQEVSVKCSETRLHGKSTLLQIRATFGKGRFIFLFLCSYHTCPMLFPSTSLVHMAYQNSRLFREIKLRSAIFQEGELTLLPREKVYSKHEGVWNLSADQGSLGTLLVTSIRIVWYSHIAVYYNVTVPYIQLQSAGLRNSKFGEALVLSVFRQSGGFILGFRIDPKEKLAMIVKEIDRIMKVATEHVDYGVHVSARVEGGGNEILRPLVKPTADQSVPEEDVEIVGNEDTAVDTFAAYFAADCKEEDNHPQYEPTLGLAMEMLPTGFTVDKLWKVA